MQYMDPMGLESTFSSGWGWGHQKEWLVAKWSVRHWLQYHTARHQHLEFIIILFDSLGICQPRSTNTIHQLQHLQYLLPKHVNGQVVSNMFNKRVGKPKRIHVPYSTGLLPSFVKGDFLGCEFHAFPPKSCRTYFSMKHLLADPLHTSELCDKSSWSSWTTTVRDLTNGLLLWIRKVCKKKGKCRWDLLGTPNAHPTNSIYNMKGGHWKMDAKASRIPSLRAMRMNLVWPTSCSPRKYFSRRRNSKKHVILPCIDYFTTIYPKTMVWCHEIARFHIRIRHLLTNRESTCESVNVFFDSEISGWHIKFKNSSSSRVLYSSAADFWAKNAQRPLRNSLKQKSLDLDAMSVENEWIKTHPGKVVFRLRIREVRLDFGSRGSQAFLLYLAENATEDWNWH